MIRTFFRLFKRLSPGGAQFIKEAYFTLSGWRFDDLVRRVELNQKWSTPADFLTQNSVDRLSTMRPLADESIAVISPLPPAETGIATCTLESFFPAEYGVDLYSTFNNAYEYLSSAHNRWLSKTNLRVFHLNALPFGHAINGYRGLVFTFGNSDHNIEIVSALLTSKTFPYDAPVFAYIHDPCILNVLERAVTAKGGSFERALRAAYPDKAGIISDAIRAKNTDMLVQEGIYGVRALVANSSLAGIIVNSAAARDLLLNDLGASCDLPIYQAFHPVFGAPSAAHSRASGTKLRIGTFGVPSPGKGTDLVLEAFRILRQKGLDAELILAGYGAGRFYEVFREAGDDNITVVDSPSDDEMESLMQSVDLALQLRRQNLGESSGAVPRLIYYGKPTIVTEIGSFKEFGDAVRQVAPDINPYSLAATIQEEAQTPQRRNEARSRYMQEHSPGRFCETLRGIVTGNYSFPNRTQNLAKSA